MIFQHTWQKVLSGAKRQTRRRIQDGQYLVCGVPFKAVLSQSRTIYAVGRTYAVQPGRGKHGVGVIRITDIWREDVRTIDRESVAHEGFSSRHDFWMTWVSMHDKAALKDFVDTTDFIHHTEQDFLMTRPQDRYLAWAILFEVVRWQ